MITKNLKCIGKGAFSTAYKLKSNKVLIKTTDPAKECMALYFPKCRLFPKIQRESYDGEYSYYTMEYFEKVKSLKNNLTPRDWELYRTLRTCGSCGCESKRLIRVLESLPSTYRTEVINIKSAIDSLLNYGEDLYFEISPRNVAVRKGRLVLLDCFFFKSNLEKVYKLKQRRNHCGNLKKN